MSKPLHIMMKTSLYCFYLLLALMAGAILSLSPPSYAETPAPAPVVLSAPIPLITLPASLPKENAVSAAETLQEDSSSWKGSLMFLPDELSALYKALAAGASYKPELPVSPDATTSASTAAARRATSSFYLNSIMYFAPNHWSIWVNGTQYSSMTSKQISPITGLNIEHISPKVVVFTWDLSQMNNLSTDWQNAFYPDDTGDFVAKSSKNIRVNKDKTILTFALRTNQSFLLSSMEVIEGLADGNTASNNEPANAVSQKIQSLLK